MNKSCGNKGMGVTGLWLGTSPLVTDTGEAGLDEMMMSSSRGGAPSSLGLGLADPPTLTISDMEELTNMLKDFLYKEVWPLLEPSTLTAFTLTFQLGGGVASNRNLH